MLTAEIDQNGIRTEYDYDKLGRLITVTDAMLNDTTFSYDEVGNKLTQTDAENRTTEWQYDALGRAIARILPLGQVELMSYNEVGNRSAMSDFNGNATTYSYDVMDQLTRADYYDGSFEMHSYNDLGQRTQTTHRYGTESWVYDERSRLASYTDINGITLTYDYDAQGNRTAVTSPSGTTSYTFDVLNRLKTVSDGSSYQYDQVGNTAKVVFANGTETAHVYDALNRLTQVDHATSATGTLFDQQVYTLMPSGHRTSITEFSGRVVDYFYDDLYRLTSEQTTDALLGNRTTAFTYDKVGNRQSRNDAGVITSYTYDLNDRMTAETTAGVTTTYSFDDQGNTLSKSDGSNSSSFAYDPNHRTLSADDGVNPITFEYDAAGVRQGRSDNASTIHYVVDSNRDYAQVIEEQDAFGITDVTYTYGLDLLSQSRGASSSYYHYDGLGSTRALTDGAGNVTDNYVYKAFGTVEAHNGLTENDYLFAGERFDDGLAQYYLRARYYDPSQGRFTQMDTFAGVNRNPVTLHKYLYANASPVNLVDPSGLFSLSSLSVANNVRSTLSTASVPSYISYVGRTVLSTAIVTGRIVGKLGIKFYRYCLKKKDKCGLRLNLLIVGNTHPHMLERIRRAQLSRPSTIALTYMPNKKRKSGWYKGRGGCAVPKPAQSYQCDEYPMQRTRQGGPENWPSRVSLEWVPGFENMSIGGYFGVLAKAMKRSKKYKFYVITTHSLPSMALPLAKRTR